MSVFKVGSNKSSQNNFPSVRPTLDLDFANSKTLDPRITFTRASGGSYTDVNGLIKYAGVNEARFDHDPVTGESLGFLVEESRTNYVGGTGGSALFAGYNFGAESIWTITAASTDVSAPDGSSLTTKAVSGSSGTTYFWKYTNSLFTHASNTTYTQSVWARVAVGTGSLALTSYPFNSQGHDITTQWKRISVTYTTDSGPSQVPYMGVAFPDYNTTFYFWGWQIEQGAFPTSYIPTEGSSRTRAADVASITGKNFSSWFSSSSGSLVSIAKTPPGVAWRFAQIIGGFGNGIYAQGSTGTGMLVDGFHANGPWQSNGRVWILGVSYSLGGNLNFGYNDYTLQSRNAFIAWSPTESRYGINGELSSGSSSSMASTVAATVNKFIIGYGDNIDAYYQPPSTVHVKRLTFYPKRLTNQQLQVLTR